MNKHGLIGESLTYLITEGKTNNENFAELESEILKLIEIAVQTKISLVQIREKKLAARFVFELAQKAVKITRHSDTKILINDRADIAMAAQANGVHLTSNSLSAAAIRRAFPRDFIIGMSAHTAEKAEIAKQQGADFITFSPIFYSSGKGRAHGVEKLKEVCERLKPFPVIALGGIDETNWQEVLLAGASGFAAIKFLNDKENLRKLALDSSR